MCVIFKPGKKQDLTPYVLCLLCQEVQQNKQNYAKLRYTERTKDDVELAFAWYEKQRRGGRS